MTIQEMKTKYPINTMLHRRNAGTDYYYFVTGYVSETETQEKQLQLRMKGGTRIILLPESGLDQFDIFDMGLQIQQRNVDLKNMTYKKVAFTGHRPNKIGGYGRHNPARTFLRTKLKEICEYMIQNCGTREFMQGMAQGIDQDAGKVILQIIEERGEEEPIALFAAVPYPSQESTWPNEAQVYYRNMLDTICDYDLGKIVYVHEDRPRNKWDAIKWLDERNHYMVDWCDLLIAVWNGTKGGTSNCIDYAKKVGKPILLLKI